MPDVLRFKSTLWFSAFSLARKFSFIDLVRVFFRPQGSTSIKKRKKRKKKQKNNCTHTDTNWWAGIQTSFCYILFNVLMLLHFFGLYLGLPLLLSTDYVGYFLDPRNYKEVTQRCIYFAFKGAWWQDLNNLLQAQPILMFSNVTFFLLFKNHLFSSEIKLDMKIDRTFIVI